MAFLSVYLDRSADGDSTVVAGYISKAGDWVDFQSAWLAWLKKYDVSYFHLKEFAHSVDEYQTGWKGQHTKRREFLIGLIKIIQAHTYHSFAAGVDHADFDAVMTSAQAIDLFGNYFTFCARANGRDIRTWKTREFPQSPVEYIFECGDAGKGRLIKIMERDGFPTPIFKSKSPPIGAPSQVYTPFEAADFLAWEIRRANKDVYVGAEWDDLRTSMRSLSFGLGTWMWHTKEHMQEALKLHGLDASSPLSRLR